MKLSARAIGQAVILFLYSNVMNFAFLLFHITMMEALRPIFVYEYLVIPIFILLRFPPIVTWLLWTCFCLLDILNSISAVYLFKLPEFLENMEFTFHYSLSLKQYLLVFLVCAYFAMNFFLIRKMTRMTVDYRRMLIGFFIICLAAVFTLDFLNGSSKFAGHQIKFDLTRLNIGGSVLNVTRNMFTDLTFTAQKPKAVPRSVTFQTFETDTTGNQMVILLESWGLPAKEDDWEKLRVMISETASSSGWKSETGSTGFEGSTTHAELRELLSLSGNYRYFLNADSAASVESIFKIKKKQGYTTMAAHSFSGKMFWRVGWWPNLGIDSVYFMENIIDRKNLKPDSLNYATPFTSVNDEAAYLFLSELAAMYPGKKFAYFLAENSHLPYYDRSDDQTSKPRQPMLTFDELSPEGDSQWKRIQELISFIARSPQSKQWSKILVMGDHMPPFTNNSDRDFYSSTKVPYFILH